MTLKRAILIALDRVHPYQLPEATLHADVNLMLPAPVTWTDVRSTASDLEATRHVVSVREELDGGVKWKITDNGRAVLAANR